MEMTPEEFKELFVPGDKQTEFMTKTYDAYVDMMAKLTKEHIDPYNFFKAKK
jgi:hypothetical protein